LALKARKIRGKEIPRFVKEKSEGTDIITFWKRKGRLKVVFSQTGAALTIYYSLSLYVDDHPNKALSF